MSKKLVALLVVLGLSAGAMLAPATAYAVRVNSDCISFPGGCTICWFIVYNDQGEIIEESWWSPDCSL